MSSLAADLEAAALIGADEGGVSRFAWTPELELVNAWFVDRLLELGLEPEIDAAGNVLGRWSTGEGTAVLVGSHLDTVPRGGRYDGALGVLAALDVVRRLRAEGVEPRRPLWVVSFNDEEGARFQTGMLGSRAFAESRLGRSEAVGEIDPDRLNVHGGSVAIGHPFGATGARMVTTMANELVERDVETALLGICAAGGLGAAAVLRRL